MIAIHNKALLPAFFVALFTGSLFWVGIFNWILVVPEYTILHHTLLAIYLGLYFGGFGLILAFISKRWSLLPALTSAPFIWISFEYIRSNISFLSLPLGLLAYSQYQYLPVIQIASITGSYAISFLIVLVNSAITVILLPIFSRKGQNLIGKGKRNLVFGAAASILIVLLYGSLTIAKPVGGEKVKVSLVQANIEQSIKWDPKYSQEIIQIYGKLTQEVAAGRPALIIWPETATPGCITLSPRLYLEVLSIARTAGTYLLFGSAHHQKFEAAQAHPRAFWNSAYLLNPLEPVPHIQRYDKIRLFPFGEYLPYHEVIPWHLIRAGGLDSYNPGNNYTVFKMENIPLGVTICWENLFPDLVRQFVKRGAQFVVNITNEGHFGKTAAPYQFASVSVFRAVENGRFVVRCGNTGVSCIIDPHGKIIDRVRDDKGQDVFIRGVLTGQVIPIASETIYTQYGDWLVFIAFLVSGGFLVAAACHGARKEGDQFCAIGNPQPGHHRSPEGTP